MLRCVCCKSLFDSRTPRLPVQRLSRMLDTALEMTDFLPVKSVFINARHRADATIGCGGSHRSCKCHLVRHRANE